MQPWLSARLAAAGPGMPPTNAHELAARLAAGGCDIDVLPLDETSGTVSRGRVCH
jgi:hypothetical protein